MDYNHFMNELTKMPNIGKALSEHLKSVGIVSAEQLIKIGSKEAFFRLKLAEPDSCINRLYALEGAVRGIRWHNLSPEIKSDLKSFFDSL